LAQNSVGCLSFEISHYIGERILCGKLPNEVSVIWHDDKTVEFEVFPKPKAVECIQNNALDDISLKEMKIIHGFRGNKVEVVRIEVGFPGHWFAFIRIPWHRAA